MRRSLLLSLLALAACMQQPGPSTTAQAQAQPQAQAQESGGCLADGQGGFEAVIRGAVETDIHWRNAQMTCDGDLRPDGSGLRITMAGPLEDARQLRFIFGIDLTDADSGPAQVLPTNLTVLVEGEALLFATRGDDKCAVEDLVRVEVQPGIERVSVRGYCVGPASDLAGETRLLVPTFSFTALARSGGEDAGQAVP